MKQPPRHDLAWGDHDKGLFVTFVIEHQFRNVDSSLVSKFIICTSMKSFSNVTHLLAIFSSTAANL